MPGISYCRSGGRTQLIYTGPEDQPPSTLFSARRRSLPAAAPRPSLRALRELVPAQCSSFGVGTASNPTSHNPPRTPHLKTNEPLAGHVRADYQCPQDQAGYLMSGPAYVLDQVGKRIGRLAWNTGTDLRPHRVIPILIAQEGVLNWTNRQNPRGWLWGCVE